MTVTTQQTSKVWKAGQGCGCLLAIFGIIGALAVAGDQVAARTVSPVLVILVLGGLLMWLSSRAAAWWFHG